MDVKHFIWLCGILVMIPITAAMAIYSYKARTWFLFLMIISSAFSYNVQITFFGRIWYRGTALGYEVSLMDILALALITGAILRPKRGLGARWYWPAALGPMLIYFCYCIASVVFSEPRMFGAWELFKVLKGILVVVAVALTVRTEKELGVLVLGLGCAVCYECLLSLKLRYANGVHRVYGTMGHPNSLSMYLCMSAPVLYAATLSNLPVWTRRVCLAGVGLAMVGVLLTISRTGFVVWGLVMLGVTVACVSPRITLKKVMVGMLAVACVAGAIGYSWKTLRERLIEETDLKSEMDQNNLGRGSYFRLAKLISSERFWGVGLNNWSWYVTNEYQEKDNPNIVYKPYLNTEDEPDLIPARGNETAQAAPAHNLGALTIGELGWVGLVLFAIVWLRWFDLGQRFLWKRSPEAMHRLGTGIFFGIGAVFLQSLTEWEFRQVPIYYTFHILIGTLAALHYARRRPQSKPQKAGQTEKVMTSQAQAAGA